MVYCEKCGWSPLPENELPLVLPEIQDYEPSENGESPLAKQTDWINTTCPHCHGPAKRETDTMPQWAGSSWYYLRYMDPHNDKELASKQAIEYWAPVDWYNGGMEHTTLHLLYSRFWHKFLYDIGVVPTKEPYQKRTSHGMILGTNGEKMSKSLGNFTTVHELLQVVNPQILRFFLATTHYRRPVNFTDDALTEAENNIKKIENAYRHLDEQAESNLSALTTFRNDFVAAMDEDFNIANGMTVFYDFVSWVNKGNGGPEVKEFFDQVLEILGIKFKFEQSLDSEIEAMIEARQLAREVRDFAKSDEIRDALKAQGIVLEDTKDGVRWHRE